MKLSSSELRLEQAVRSILDEIGIKKGSETYKNTPRRVAKMYLELFSGMDESNEPKITLFSNTGYNDIIAVKKIPFYSVCAHHMLPIFGDVSIAYIPGEKIVGLSKIPRVVKFFSQRLQVQETFSEQIADYLLTKLNAKGVFVLVKARHLCLEMRGVTMPNLETVSSTARGIFETSQAKREEALQMMINGNP